MTAAARAGIALAAACFCLCLGAPGSALARSKKHDHGAHKSRHRGRHADIARGKRHLKKANALAGEAQCAAAIAEYTLAYELLNDPVVLFNRAECYRRIEDNEKAADDYHAFLEKVPNAPNRGAIEKKLLALEAPDSSEREKPEKPAEAPPPAKVAETPPPPAKVSPPKVAEAPPPAKVPPPAPKVVEAPPPPPPAAKPDNEPEPVVVVRQPAAAPPLAPAPPPREEPAQAGGSRPWVWVALTVLAVGAGVAGYLVFRPHEQSPPETALGNYRF